MYTFKLAITKEQSTLFLLDDGKEQVYCEWSEGRDMGRRLFEGMVELLQKNNVQPVEVRNFIIESTLPENSTSLRIAETVKRVYAFGVSSLK